MNNLELMTRRLMWQGGIPQENRMIKDKFRTLQRALKYSYQACTVAIVQPYSQVLLSEEDEVDPEMTVQKPERALINPDKVKQDYDDKIISIPYECGFNPGDVFEWKKTNTYWLIYTQEITEDAYFRGEIRRCRYRLKFKDKSGKWCSTWAAIRGPVETQIDSIQKNQDRIDKPNLSLNILMPRNEHTLQAFERYQKFIFQGRCWQVKAHDGISMKNVIEVNAEENYINKMVDDVENEMKDGLVIEPVDPTPNSGIDGKTFIIPSVPEKYSSSEDGGVWSIVENVPVRISSQYGETIEVVWKDMVSGQFTLQWQKDDIIKQKTIVVESLY